ncbi:iron-containing alcohol dehydrogenase [Methylobacterium nodulans]|uniref:Iron-containing alcohol dehydrogenase n=1 Tax=Methylobacterium nodulans (strain LMG 21967 / CNCM I-2342 / ORS 2060) TaxID=460265 RepID=B8IU68_METNO|nr:iron-containing alcohol dehydrogenase [Methylobacterium nodulans]ACL55113.1 iron-containing alcohol dehydrogenase [Methylobacterium nodulans ORS 2060]
MGLITYLTRIQFERGAIRLIDEELALLGARRPLIVTDRGVVAAGLIARIAAASRLVADAPVFDATPENPTEAAVLAARDLFREHGCDAVVAVGGGSPLDLAKGAALLATHAEPLAQYAAILGGLPRIRADQPPVLAVPTTAGTGSEVGRAALITLSDGRKLGFISPHLIPNVAICDPELTIGLPPGLTAATGMDAVTHCIETYLSPRYNPPAEAIALDGLRRATRALRRAVRDGGDLEAREDMMMAALEGGMTFQKGLGAVHSMSHALGGRQAKPLHHGTLNAVILPHVLRFNEPACTDKYAALREAMNLPPGADLPAAIEALNRDLGLPATLAELGVTAQDCEGLIPWAVEDHSTATNGRPLGADDFRHLFIAALGSS